MLRVHPEQITINNEPIIDLIRRPKKTLLQVRDALQSQDFVLLADILQYEFGDVTDHGHQIVARLRQEGEILETGNRP